MWQFFVRWCMRKIFSSVLAFSIVIWPGWVFAQSEVSSKYLAAKVADYVMDSVKFGGQSVVFNSGNSDEGEQIKLQFYTQNAVYIVTVYRYKNPSAGRQALNIDHYLTISPLLSTRPGDLIADELINGRPKIYLEEHLYDGDLDGKVDIYQTFVKKRSTTFAGFTREERDRPNGGVEQILFEDGKFVRKGKRIRATVQELKDVGDQYREQLEEIVKQLGIK
jgi:hypothetical protein